MSDTRGVVVLDNGSGSVKAGLDQVMTYVVEIFPMYLCLPAYSMPNAIMRSGGSKQVYVGDEMIYSGAEASYATAKWWKRPSERGIVVDWALQQKIWDRAFHNILRDESCVSSEDLSFEELGLLYTQPPMCPPLLQNVTHEVAFELYGFDSIYRCSPSFLALQHHREQTKTRYGRDLIQCCESDRSAFVQLALHDCSGLGILVHAYYAFCGRRAHL